MTRTISASRKIAFAVLTEVRQGAYASDALRAAATDADSRDAGLASQIIFGCLRHQKQLDYLIFLYSGRRATELEPPIALVLRMGIFQLRYLARIPAHAAVHESVEIAKQSKRAAAGLVNAVLRKVSRGKVDWPDESTELDCPNWLLKDWTRQFGHQAARAIAEKATEEPAQYVRLRADDPLIGSEGVQPTDVPGAYQLLTSPTQGSRFQDVSSQAIVPLLDLEEGNTLLDLCAAPGNKTMQALETSLPFAVACDISQRRLREMPPICPRVVLDGTMPLPFAIPFDRIFIDAPCSGTGTLARNPEIKWRLRREDLARFSERQEALLGQAWPLLKTGGKLVYSTCSLQDEENANVVASFRNKHPEAELAQELWRIPGRTEGDGFYAAVLVHSN